VGACLVCERVALAQAGQFHLSADAQREHFREVMRAAEAIEKTFSR
jgi:hypothetical protein